MTIAQMLRREGRKEGREEGRRDALRRLLILKFKLPALDEAYEGRLRAATLEMLDQYLQRVLIADSLPAVFED